MRPQEERKFTKYGEQRRGLLAKVHIATKALDIPDEDYREILKRDFRAKSSKALSIRELQELVRYFESKGWRPTVKPKPYRGESQARALRDRAVEIAGQLPDGERRLAALAKKLCGVDRLSWCKDVGKLERLLAALGKISRMEGWNE